MTCIAPRYAIEQRHPPLLDFRKRRLVTFEIAIEPAVVVPPLGRHESPKGIADLDNRHILSPFDVIEGRDEHLAIFGNDPHPLGEDRPDVVDPVVDGARNLVFLRIARHFKARGQRKQRLSRQDSRQPLGQPFLGGRVESVAIKVRHLKPPVMEQDRNLACTKVPKCGRVAGYTFPYPVGSTFCPPLGAKSLPALADPEAQTVTARKVMVMARATSDIPVARQQLVIEQKLADLGLQRIDRQEVGIAKRTRQVSCSQWQGKTEGSDLKQTIHGTILALLLGLATPVEADIEEARDLMEAGEFEEARAALLPFARSGNADAEELIGVMYALGLGVEQDRERAFEWYLRASMKGHPGAQSGIGWYYELGLGLPSPDLVRAYMWYALSAIGGDPDAVDSLEEIQTRMTADEIARAQVLVNDYKPWMYPFR